MLTVNQERRNLLSQRYKDGKIAALNNQCAPCLKNVGGYYCLMGAMMTDEEIELPTLDIFNEVFDSIQDYPVIYGQHDPYVLSTSDKTPVIEAIERIIETGVVVP
jgi:hypothetical protein